MPEEPTMKVIAPADLHRQISSGQEIKLWDVRTAVEFGEVHVPQAKNLPLDRLDPDALRASGQLPERGPVYLLCRSGARASQAAEKLRAAGCTEAIVVEGGTLAWMGAGFPVQRGKVMSLERQVRIAAGSLVLVGFVLSQWVHPALIFLSAFVGAGLVFAGITDWCGMGLLLAKAPWNNPGRHSSDA